jgi:hypothetical protein
MKNRRIKNTDSKRNFTEDFKHENGNYENICHTCGNRFLGHKRRITCKECLKKV